jgi:hypothetical protein
MDKLHFSVHCETAKGAIDRWHKQYGFGVYKLADGRDAGKISKQLRDLKRPTKKQVDKIIGDNGWTNIWCSGCYEYKPKVVTFGDDYSVEVCESCLRLALARLVGQQNHE